MANNDDTRKFDVELSLSERIFHFMRTLITRSRPLLLAYAKVVCFAACYLAGLALYRAIDHLIGNNTINTLVGIVSTGVQSNLKHDVHLPLRWCVLGGIFIITVYCVERIVVFSEKKFALQVEKEQDAMREFSLKLLHRNVPVEHHCQECDAGHLCQKKKRQNVIEWRLARRVVFRSSVLFWYRLSDMFAFYLSFVLVIMLTNTVQLSLPRHSLMAKWLYVGSSAIGCAKLAASLTRRIRSIADNIIAAESCERHAALRIQQATTRKLSGYIVGSAAYLLAYAVWDAIQTTTAKFPHPSRHHALHAWLSAALIIIAGTTFINLLQVRIRMQVLPGSPRNTSLLLRRFATSSWFAHIASSAPEAGPLSTARLQVRVELLESGATTPLQQLYTDGMSYIFSLSIGSALAWTLPVSLPTTSEYVIPPTFRGLLIYAICITCLVSFITFVLEWSLTRAVKENQAIARSQLKHWLHLLHQQRQMQLKNAHPKFSTRSQLKRWLRKIQQRHRPQLEQAIASTTSSDLEFSKSINRDGEPPNSSSLLVNSAEQQALLSSNLNADFYSSMQRPATSKSDDKKANMIEVIPVNIIPAILGSQSLLGNEPKPAEDDDVYDASETYLESLAVDNYVGDEFAEDQEEEAAFQVQESKKQTSMHVVAAVDENASLQPASSVNVDVGSSSQTSFRRQVLARTFMSQWQRALVSSLRQGLCLLVAYAWVGLIYLFILPALRFDISTLAATWIFAGVTFVIYMTLITVFASIL